MKNSKNVYDDLLTRDIHLTNVFDVYSSYDSPFKLKSGEMIFTIDKILHEGLHLAIIEGPYRSMVRDTFYFNLILFGLRPKTKSGNTIHIMIDCKTSLLEYSSEFDIAGGFRLNFREEVEKFLQNIDVIRTFNTL